MPITVQAQGQKFTFPDGTTEAQIGEALDSHFSGTTAAPAPVAKQIDPQGLTADQLNRLEELQGQFAQEQFALQESNAPSGLQAGLIGIGKGLTDVGQTLGNIALPGQPFQTNQGEQQAFETLKETNPVASRVGEFVGETLATAPLGGLAGSLGKSLATKLGTTIGARTATTAGIIGQGAAEGAAVAGQLGEDLETGAALGAGANILMPAIFRSGLRAFQKLTGKTATTAIFDETTGELTELAAKELQDAGIPIATFAEEVETLVKQNFDPTVDLGVQTRQAQLQEFAPGVEARPSRLAQDMAAQNAEVVQIGLGTPQGRNLQVAETAVQEGLQTGAQTKLLGDLDVELISNFNLVSNDANRGLLGESAKVAITEIRTADKKAVDALYTAARDLAGDGQLVTTSNVLGAFTKGANDLAPSDGLMGATGRALKEFNVIEEGTDLAEGFQFKSPIELKPLTLDNAEELRKRLNQLDPRDDSQDSLFISTIRQQLDNEVDGLIDAFPEEAAAAIAFKQARQASADFKTTFNDKALVSKLVNFKKGTKTEDVIPAEKVLDTMLRSPLKSVKQVKSLMLEKATPESKKAWNEMKFVVIDDVLRGAMDKNTGNLSGQRLNTSLAKIGDERLKLVLGNEKFAQLKRFQTVLSDQTIPLQRLENPAGTSGPMMAMISSMGDLLKGSANASSGGLVEAASKGTVKRKILEQSMKDIQSATGRSGRVKRLKAQKVIAEFLRELSVVGVATTGTENQ